MPDIQILIVDDHKIIREGVSSILSDSDSLYIAGAAKNGEEALAFCEEHPVDVIIMDIMMPVMNGIEATSKLLQKHPDLKILALTMVSDEEVIRQMIKAGAMGYIFKNSGKQELADAINTISQGKHYFSSEATFSIMMDQNGPPFTNKSQVFETDLTDRELEVLKLICQEFTNQEIAEQLYISVRTVDAHRRNLLQKTGARNTAGLVYYAMKRDLFNL